MTSRSARQRFTLLTTVVLALVMVAGAPGAAAPGADPDGATSGSSLRAKLDEAARAYNDAKARLDTTRHRQSDLAAQARTLDLKLAIASEQAGALAVEAYKGGRIGAISTLLDSGSPDSFLERALSLETQLQRQNEILARLHRAQSELDAAKTALDQAEKLERAQLADVEKRKKDAEKALAALAGGASAGFSGGRVTASPAPRNPDGSWPPESCSVPDPTTSGCLTPRTLHAYQEARLAGFTHYTACWRSGGSGEHPKGRACDFAAAPNGFGGVAYGADKAYGDRLAAWFLANCNQLGVLYVIWYKQIWMPGIGWRAYSGDGTPSGDHMNHVHLSVV
ncbi:MAG TPA: hypothetical protein VF054_12415 [Micromonosporaceae bacterium]